MNEQEIENIFLSIQLNTIELNLREMINSFKMTNDQKTKISLKAFFNYIFKYLEEKIEIHKVHEFVNLMILNILQLANIFPDILNNHINKLLKDLETEEVCDLRKIVNSSLLIVYMTNKLNQPNQILTNYILLINLQMDKLILDSEDYSNSNFLLKVYLLGVLSALCENTKSYNPSLFNHLEHILHFINEKLETSFLSNNSYSDSTLNNLKQIKEKNSNIILESSKIYSGSFYKIISMVKSLMKTFKDDINFDLIFKNIILTIFKIKNNKKTDPEDKIIQSIIENYENLKSDSLKKKNVEINFMIIKKKALPSLEPEIDLSFLGQNYINTNANSQKVAKAIKKKVNSTRKQAIRNLKKEAKVIDVQRQKVLKKIENRRRDDLKASNQFIEQQNIEYKQMVTSQPKKRLKLKMRGKSRA